MTRAGAGARRRAASPHQRGGGFRPPVQHAFEGGVAAGNALAFDDGAKSGGGLTPPPRLGGCHAVIGEGQRLETRRITDDLESGEERDGQRRGRGGERLTEIVERDAAAADGEGLVERAAQRLPLVAPA